MSARTRWVPRGVPKPSTTNAAGGIEKPATARATTASSHEVDKKGSSASGRQTDKKGQNRGEAHSGRQARTQKTRYRKKIPSDSSNPDTRNNRESEKAPQGNRNSAEKPKSKQHRRDRQQRQQNPRTKQSDRKNEGNAHRKRREEGHQSDDKPSKKDEIQKEKERSHPEERRQRKREKEAKREERRKRREERDKRKAEETERQKKIEAEKREREAREAEAKRIEDEKRRAKEEAEQKAREEEERIRQEEEEKKRVEARRKESIQILSKLKGKLQKERASREMNLKAKEERPSLSRSLNSKMSKTTGFIKKLKTLPEQDVKQLSNEFDKLNLSKYVMEMAKAIADIRISRGADVEKVLEMSSTIYRRYDGFSSVLYDLLLRNFGLSFKKGDRKVRELDQEELDELQDGDANAETTTKDDPMRKRGSLRVMAELFKLGVFDECSPIVHIVINLDISDFDSGDKAHVNLALLNSFLKCAGQIFTGIIPLSFATTLKDAGVSSFLPDSDGKTNVDNTTEDIPLDFRLSSTNLVSIPLMKKCRNAVLEKQKRIFSTLEGYHKQIVRKRRRKSRLELTQGEAPEKLIEELTQLQASFEALQKPSSLLSDLVGQKMQDFPEPEDDEEDNLEQLEVIKLEGVEDGDWTQQLFEDPETKSFYEDLIDLNIIIPKKLLEVDKSEEGERDKDSAIDERKTKLETDQKDGQDEESNKDADDPDDFNPDKLLTENQASSEVIDELARIGVQDSATESSGNASTLLENEPKHHPFDMLLQAAGTARTAKQIDEVATTFCQKFNSKISRHRLVRQMLSLDWRMTELIPYHVRLIATLSNVIPDIGQQVTAAIFKQLWGQIKGKSQFYLGSKLRNIIFIAELTKFRVAKPKVALSCWTLCLKDFSNHAVNLACTLLERCGRWLFVNERSRVRCSALLERMMQLRKKRYYDIEKQNLIDNAYHMCRPSSQVAHIPEKKRPVLQKYIRNLIRSGLASCSTSSDAAILLKRLRKLPWDDQCHLWVVKAICNVGRIKFDKLGYLAYLVAGLSKYHPVKTTIVDAVLEELRYGLEHNRDYALHQSQLALCRFLGELYSYHMLDLQPILDTLYAMITVGHTIDPKTKQLSSKIDPPADSFRARLVCMLLDTCGVYFESRSEKKRLERFLLYFQRYLLLKRFIPVDLEFLVADLLDRLCPKFKRIPNLDEAERRIKKVERRENAAMRKGKATQGLDRLSRLDDIIEEQDEIEEKDQDAEEPEAQDRQDDEDAHDNEQTQTKTVEDESQEWTRRRAHQKEDDDFLKEMDQMVLSDYEARRIKQDKDMHKMPDPTALMSKLQSPESQQKIPAAGPSGLKPSSIPKVSSGKMVFKLLTKRGGSGKTDARDLMVPSESQMARSTVSNRQKIAEEKTEIKRLIMEGIRREGEAEFREELRQANLGAWSSYSPQMEGREGEMRTNQGKRFQKRRDFSSRGGGRRMFVRRGGRRGRSSNRGRGAE
mmetsp:Transcript_27619/g.67177  ORF Transcript_27619/g.67177 Transcript_27619/m.67177 type:complete len:1475 (+) Transcript_27619:251-4675(+)